MAAGVTSQAPHGGIFVFFAIGNFGMFLLAILVGTLVMGFMVVALKRWARRPCRSTRAPRCRPAPRWPLPEAGARRSEVSAPESG